MAKNSYERAPTRSCLWGTQQHSSWVRPFRNAELYKPRTGLSCMVGPEIQGSTFIRETVQNPYSCRVTA